MIKLIAISAIAFVVASAVQAMPRAPLSQSEVQSESMILKVRQGCGAGRIRVNGVCTYRGDYRGTVYGYRYRPYGYYGDRPLRRAYWRNRMYRRW